MLVADVDANSPGAEAGVLRGDILLSIGHEDLTARYAEDLPGVEWQIAELPVGEPLPVRVSRGGSELALEITLEPKGKVEGDSFDCHRWNLTVKEITRHETPELQFYSPDGVYVYGVAYPGNASDTGVRRRDIITAVDGEPVDSLEDLTAVYERIVADEDREQEVLIEVLRGGYKKWINLDYRKDYDKE